MAAHMEDFFAGVESRQHAWPAGREDLHWHLLHDAALVEEQLVVPYRELSHHPGLAPVPAQWVHTTVMHGGPVDQYTETEITAVVDRVGEACATIAPFDLIYDRPSVGTVAVECPARPGAAARRLWELTTGIDADVTGGRFPRIPDYGYYPHVSLAYGVGGPERADRRAMKAWLSDHPGGPVVLRATHLSLVAQRHDRRHITWSPIAVVPLTPAAVLTAA
ncbi:2'-5' RNA ligase family protein [Streptomyces sp. NPDC048484]|uniref:2'-5' RNA ligase family protein n=1 Tax=Streptomyces sp. NPDC048484 TaxID=3155146 RepID=UPI003438400B